MNSREIAIENIRLVERKLGHLREKAVFLGGSITALLLTDPAAPDVRPTKDVDVVVQTASLAEAAHMDEELRQLNFRHCMDAGGPACRWIDDFLDAISAHLLPDAASQAREAFLLKQMKHIVESYARQNECTSTQPVRSRRLDLYQRNRRFGV